VRAKPIIPDPPITAYEPFFRPGAVFVTCGTVNSEPVLGQAATAHLLRTVLQDVRSRVPFNMLGWVILPDQVHLLIRPDEESQTAEIVRRMRRRYERDYPQLMGIPGEVVVWDPTPGIESVVDVEVFAWRLDSLHYAPVQRGLIARPEEWAQSSYRAWVERGLYKLGWGWSLPDRLA
jgi:putative transposase